MQNVRHGPPHQYLLQRRHLIDVVLSGVTRRGMEILGLGVIQRLGVRHLDFKVGMILAFKSLLGDAVVKLVD